MEWSMQWLFRVGVVAMLAGCAAPEVSPTIESAAPGKAVLVTIRDVPKLRTAPLLAHLSDGSGAAVELVARMEDGRTVSVGQPDAAGLKPGDAITLQEGPPSRMIAAN